jgi:hypothetical protein
VDEISADHINADDSDYISTTTGTTIEFLLDGLTDPGDNTNHILRFRCKSEGSKGAERCDVALVDATFGVIASTNNNSASRGAFDIFQLAIADTDAANITSYSNLSVHITATVAAGESVQISWVELEVPASASTAPFVTTIAEAGVTDIQATVGGNVTSDGNDTLTEVGVYYSTSAGFTPPGEGTRLIDPDPPQPVVGNFTLDLTGLLAGTTYYYQAFAANGIGETIADLPQEQFTTKDTPVMLATPTVTIDSPTSATLGGTMTSNGFDPTGVSDCGIEWGDTSGGPYTQVSAGVCTENNAFFAPQLVDLTTGQDYFFRSYATNSVDTGYSNERSFRPVDTPSVTGTIDDLLTTETTAVLGGDITDTGGDTVTAVGIIWDTDSDPISNDNGADVTMVVPDPVSDPFSQTVTGLPAGTPLWFVAYASNGAGVGYSAVVPFTTDPGAPTMDPTPTVTDVDVDRATLGGKMTSDGGGAISDCGVEYRPSRRACVLKMWPSRRRSPA